MRTESKIRLSGIAERIEGHISQLQQEAAMLIRSIDDGDCETASAGTRCAQALALRIANLAVDLRTRLDAE